MWFSARKTRRDARTNCIVRRHLARPRLENLEDRTLLAAPWPFSIGGSNTDKGQDIATVPAGLPDAGSVYVTGFFGSKTDFDPSTTGTAYLSPISSNLVDQFLAKYDSNGNFLWARHISGTGAGGQLANVAVGPDGSVYFAGWFTGTGGITGVESTTTTTRVEHPVPGGNNLVSSHSTQGKKATYYQDGLVARFDADGGLTWVKLFGGVGATTQPNDLAVDASGAVYVTGKFTGTVDFDPGPGVASRASAGGDDIFAARLDADGTFGWASTAGAAGTDLGYSIAAAADGGAYLVGNFEATVSFGGTVLPSNGSSDAVVARLAPDGAFAWARRMGGTGMERGRGVAAFRDGTVDTVYVAGDFVSPTARFADPINYPGDAGTPSLTHSGGSTYLNGFVSKLVDTGVAGNFVWTDALSPPPGATTGGLAVYNLTVDALGGVYTTGQFSSTIDFDPGSSTAPLTATTSAVYVSKFNADGSYAWARQDERDHGRALRPWHRLGCHQRRRLRDGQFRRFSRHGHGHPHGKRLVLEAGEHGRLRREARPAQPAARLRRCPGPRPPDSHARPGPARPGPGSRPLAGPRCRHLPPRPHRHRHRRPRRRPARRGVGLDHHPRRQRRRLGLGRGTPGGTGPQGPLRSHGPALGPDPRGRPPAGPRPRRGRCDGRDARP